jgi:hypothetical protein
VSILSRTALRPARPYIAAEARARASWYAATTAVRLSILQVGTFILAAWGAASLVASLIWPEQVVVAPAFFAWSKVWFLVIAIAVIVGIFRRRRLERVNFYNVLIENGPTEFAAILRKRAFVPPKSLWHRPKRPISTAPSLKRPNASEAGRLLEDNGILTCPNGHPLNGRSLFAAEFSMSRRPAPRNLVCARCLKPVFPPVP